MRLCGDTVQHSYSLEDTLRFNGFTPYNVCCETMKLAIFLFHPTHLIGTKLYERIRKRGNSDNNITKTNNKYNNIADCVTIKH